MAKATAIVVAAMMVITAVPAQAAGHSWKVGNDSYHIYFADLDLAAPDGRAAGLARVEKAAAKLCEASPTKSERRDCMKETLARAGASWLTLAQRERTYNAWALANR